MMDRFQLRHIRQAVRTRLGANKRATNRRQSAWRRTIAGRITSQKTLSINWYLRRQFMKNQRHRTVRMV